MTQEFPGRLIVIEGADGSGKTTLAKKLARELDAFYTSEPSETAFGEKLDDLIEEGVERPETVALAFAADRMIHVEEEIVPRLEEGDTVVSDRYYHSSLVYQPLMGLEEDWVRQLNRAAVSPDQTFILDIPVEEAQERISERQDRNSFEKPEFEKRVVERYRKISDMPDTHLVDGSLPPEKVFEKVFSAIENRKD